MSLKNVLEKYISVGDRLYMYYLDVASTLSPEEVKKATTLFSVKVAEFDDYAIITFNEKNGEENDYSIFEIIFHSIIYNDKGEVFNREALKKDIEEIYPNAFLLTPQRIKERIKEGYGYKFFPMGVDKVSQEVLNETVDSKKLFTVKQIDFEGLVSDGGFLDLADTILDCLYFNFEGNLVDTSDLREDLLKRWEQK